MRYKELEERNLLVWNAIYSVRHSSHQPNVAMLNGAGGEDSGYYWDIDLLSWGGVPIVRYTNFKDDTVEFKIVTTRNLVKFIQAPYLENFHKLPRAKGGRKRIRDEWKKLNEIVEMAEVARENKHNSQKNVGADLYFGEDFTIYTAYRDGSILIQVWAADHFDRPLSNYYIVDPPDMLKLMAIADDDDCSQAICDIERKYMRHPHYSEQPIDHEDLDLYEHRYFFVGCTIAN